VDRSEVRQAMKINRHEKAKILSQSEIQLLFNEGFQSDRDRALFGVCLYTACRINEACTLNTQDVYDKKMRVRGEIIFRRENTKGKLAARAVPVIEKLRELLMKYKLLLFLKMLMLLNSNLIMIILIGIL